jgi:hypothetical protein
MAEDAVGGFAGRPAVTIARAHGPAAADKLYAALYRAAGARRIL